MSTNCQQSGSSLLPIIAEHADIGTIVVVASSHSLRHSHDSSVGSLTGAREILYKRLDYDEKLSEGFNELVTIVEVVSTAGSNDSLAESGLLFLTARSSFHSE